MQTQANEQLLSNEGGRNAAESERESVSEQYERGRHQRQWIDPRDRYLFRPVDQSRRLEATAAASDSGKHAGRIYYSKLVPRV